VKRPHCGCYECQACQDLAYVTRPIGETSSRSGGSCDGECDTFYPGAFVWAGHHFQDFLFRLSHHNAQREFYFLKCINYRGARTVYVQRLCYAGSPWRPAKLDKVSEAEIVDLQLPV
jgi:hypothetical protein